MRRAAVVLIASLLVVARPFVTEAQQKNPGLRGHTFFIPSVTFYRLDGALDVTKWAGGVALNVGHVWKGGYGIAFDAAYLKVQNTKLQGQGGFGCREGVFAGSDLGLAYNPRRTPLLVKGGISAFVYNCEFGGDDEGGGGVAPYVSIGAIQSVGGPIAVRGDLTLRLFNSATEMSPLGVSFGIGFLF